MAKLIVFEKHNLPPTPPQLWATFLTGKIFNLSDIVLYVNNVYNALSQGLRDFHLIF